MGNSASKCARRETLSHNAKKLRSCERFDRPKRTKKNQDLTSKKHLLLRVCPEHTGGGALYVHCFAWFEVACVSASRVVRTACVINHHSHDSKHSSCASWQAAQSVHHACKGSEWSVSELRCGRREVEVVTQLLMTSFYVKFCPQMSAGMCDGSALLISQTLFPQLCCAHAGGVGE